MSRILYEFRCICKEDPSLIKKRKSNKLSKRKPSRFFDADTSADANVDEGPSKTSVTKKRKRNKVSEGKPLPYPDTEEGTSKTFQIKYEKKLSSIAKLVLNGFQKKYLYYAIDDILYLLKANPIERDNLLAILYSPIISLQNNLSINFFDIWINEIYINETPKINKFLSHDSKNFEQFSYITIKLLYKTRIPIKKQESLW